VKKRGNSRGAKGAGHPRPNQYGQLETGGTERFGRKVATFTGWHEPRDRRLSSTVLREARGEIPRAYSASSLTRKLEDTVTIHVNTILAARDAAQPNSVESPALLSCRGIATGGAEERRQSSLRPSKHTFRLFEDVQCADSLPAGRVFAGTSPSTSPLG
jgi:hypothetical protein